MATVTPSGRRAALLAIVAMLGALLGVSLPASADTATNQVFTTATTPYQTNVAPNGPLKGLKNLDVITLNATATGLGTPPANNIIFSMDARLCRTGLNI